MDTQSKGLMKLTRRQFLLAAIPAPLLLSACSDPKPQRDPVLPDQAAHVGVDMGSGTSRSRFIVFRFDPDGVWRMDDAGWTKISEAL